MNTCAIHTTINAKTHYNTYQYCCNTYSKYWYVLSCICFEYMTIRANASQMHTIIHSHMYPRGENLVLHRSSIGMYFLCIVVCISMYWHVFGMHWHVTISVQHSEHTGFRLEIGIGMYLVCIDMYCACIEMYWNGIRAELDFKACIVISIVSCIRLIFVWICMYEQVFACIASRIQCRHSSSVPYRLQNHVSCNNYCSYKNIQPWFPVIFSPQDGQWETSDLFPSINVEQCASSPRLIHLVTFARGPPAGPAGCSQSAQSHQTPLDSGYPGLRLPSWSARSTILTNINLKYIICLKVQASLRQCG